MMFGCRQAVGIVLAAILSVVSAVPFQFAVNESTLFG
jgi:hypothetical protein